MSGNPVFSIVRSILAGALMFPSCVSPSPSEPQRIAVMPAAAATTHAFSWYQGSVDDAFTQAAKEKKPLFLFWGAAWCPSCNEIKAEVLHQPRFAQLMAPFIAVYLDGDADNAQIWGEKLAISGYPTLIIFDPAGHEMVRLSEGVNIDEFAMAIDGALHHLETLPATLKRALSGLGADSDFRLLAYASWDPMLNDAKDPATLLADRERLMHLMPDRLAAEKALIAAQILESAYDNRDEDKFRAYTAATKGGAAAYLDAIFADDGSIMAARECITQRAEIMAWLYPSPADPLYRLYSEKWRKAAAKLADNPAVAVDLRLLAVYPELQFYRMEHGSKKKGEKEPPFSAGTVTKVRDLTALAISRIRTEYERHTVIPAAAELLAHVGEMDAARKMLQDEIRVSSTPWYYTSGLALLEKEQGNTKEALAYAAAARQSAKGTATRLQWITSDLFMSLECAGDDHARLLALLDEYYTLALSLPDGFSGRNGKRAQRVLEGIKPLMSQQPFKDKVRSFAGRCQRQRDEVKGRCQQHFAALL